MMLLALTFRLLDAIRMFDTIFIMTGGGPGTSTYTASYYLYTVGFTQFHLSQATAGSWLFLIFTAMVVTLLVRRLLKSGAGLMAAVRSARRVRAPLRSGRTHPAARLLPRIRAVAALLDVQHVDQAERRLSGDPAGMVPASADPGALRGGAVRLSRARRADQQPDHLARRDCAFGSIGHADGLQPGALQHRRPASLLLGAVAALPSADRHRAAGVPDLSRASASTTPMSG